MYVCMHVYYMASDKNIRPWSRKNIFEPQYCSTPTIAHTYIHTYIHVRTCTYIHDNHTHTHIHTYIHVHTCAYIHDNHTHTHTSAGSTHISIHTYIHVHIRTHTHTQLPDRPTHRYKISHLQKRSAVFVERDRDSNNDIRRDSNNDLSTRTGTGAPQPSSMILVCLYVCIHTYIHTYIHIYIYIYIHIHIHTYLVV